MNLRFLAISSLSLALACGGADPADTTTPAATADPAAGAPAAAGARLTFGEGTLTLAARGEQVEVVLRPDGSFQANVPASGDRPAQSRHGEMTAGGELTIDGDAVARIGEDGTVSVLSGYEEVVDGKVVKSESEWKDVGELSPEGVFTAAKDGATFAFGEDGVLTGFPDELQIRAELADPAQRRSAMLLVVAFFAGGKVTSETSSPNSGPAAPAPAPAPTEKK